jgi:PAS domain S-box-containing protein
MFKSIRTRLKFAFIVIGIVPILVVALIISFKSVSFLNKEAYAHQLAEAERVSVAVNDYIMELQRVLELTGKAHSFLSLGRLEQRNILEELLAYENRFDELGLLNNDGKELIRCNRTQVVFNEALADRSGDPVFQKVMAMGDTYFSPVQFNSDSGEPHMIISIPLQSFVSNKIEYILHGSVRLKKIWELLTEIGHSDETIIIVDESGNIVAHPDPSIVLSGQKYFLPESSSRIVTGLAGSQVIMASKQLELGEQTFHIIAQQGVDKAKAFARSIIFISLLVVGIFLIFAICISTLVIRNIVRPLEHLSSVARDIEQGDLSKSVDYDRKDEVGKLGKSFNAMTQCLRITIENLEKEVGERKGEITERKKAEIALSKSRTMLRQILDTIPQAIFWKDLDSVYLGCNHVFAKDIGLNDPNLIKGKTDFDLPWPREEAEAYRADDLEVMQLNQPKLHIIEPLQQADGRRLLVDTTKVLLLNEQGKVYGVLGIYEDITERKQAEEKAHRFNRVLERSLNEIYIFDAETLLFIEVNRGARENLGYTMEELSTLTPVDIKPDFSQELFEKAIEPLLEGTQEKLEFFTIHQRKDGTLYPVEVHLQLMTEGTPVFIAFILDITERRQAETEKARLESQLLQAQKIEAVGTLAGGIAHDFNNILSAIIGYAEFIRDEVPADSRIGKDIAQVLASGDRAVDLVKQILTFKRC